MQRIKGAAAMDMIGLTAAGDLGVDRLERLAYRSGYDGYEDWAMMYAGDKVGEVMAVMIHGHGSRGDQLYTREDIRKIWLPYLLERGWGILTPTLRGNSWMGPAAAADMHDLVMWAREAYGTKRFIFASGSMGGTSNLIYAALRPEDVDAVVSRGAACDLSSYHAFCRAGDLPIHGEIADAIEASYGGGPAEQGELYERHSALVHAERLTMPIHLSHGGADATIPVEQSRGLAAKLHGQEGFVYLEIPGGNHDSPLFLDEPHAWLDELVRTW